MTVRHKVCSIFVKNDAAAVADSHLRNTDKPLVQAFNLQAVLQPSQVSHSQPSHDVSTSSLDNFVCRAGFGELHSHWNKVPSGARVNDEGLWPSYKESLL